jgi:hypothetical protein
MVANLPRAFSTHGLGLGSSWGESPILLLHLAYSEEEASAATQIRKIDPNGVDS